MESYSGVHDIETFSNPLQYSMLPKGFLMLSDHNLLCHFSADRNAGVLHIHNHIAPDGVYYSDRPSHDKTKVLQMCLNFLFSSDFPDNVFLSNLC